MKSRAEDQISITDPDSRAVVFQRNAVNVGYNIQASSDAKYKLLVEYNTGDVNDTNALASMALSTKALLQVDRMKVLADKGYHTGRQLKTCSENNISTYVSPRTSTIKKNGTYSHNLFVYNNISDTYTCPQGSILATNGNWHTHRDENRGRLGVYRFLRYTTSDCNSCESRSLCTQSKINGRTINRTEYADIVDENTKRVKGNPEYYRKRQQVTEHMFGTLKRQRGFTHTLMRGKEKVLGEVGLMFIGYNLGRCVSILGAKALIKALRNSILPTFKLQIRLILSLFEAEKLKYYKMVY